MIISNILRVPWSRAHKPQVPLPNTENAIGSLTCATRKWALDVQIAKFSANHLGSSVWELNLKNSSMKFGLMRSASLVSIQQRDAAPHLKHKIIDMYSTEHKIFRSTATAAVCASQKKAKGAFNTGAIAHWCHIHTCTRCQPLCIPLFSIKVGVCCK